MSYRFVDSCREQDQDGTTVPSWSCSKAVYKILWHITLLSVQWINSWWWTDELSETCRVSCQNKFVTLLHLVGFIIKKYVTMHGHMNVKNYKVFNRRNTVLWILFRLRIWAYLFIAIPRLTLYWLLRIALAPSAARSCRRRRSSRSDPRDSFTTHFNLLRMCVHQRFPWVISLMAKPTSHTMQF